MTDVEQQPDALRNKRAQLWWRIARMLPGEEAHVMDTGFDVLGADEASWMLVRWLFDLGAVEIEQRPIATERWEVVVRRTSRSMGTLDAYDAAMVAGRCDVMAPRHLRDTPGRRWKCEYQENGRASVAKRAQQAKERG